MKLPTHLAIIMDGNGRWAQNQGKRRLFGHVKGVSRVRSVIADTARLKIPYLTLYAFSMENWLRPKEEVRFLMRLLVKFLTKEVKDLVDNNIRLQTIGDTSYLPEEAQETLNAVIQKTKDCDGMVLTLALSYGSRQEITQAVRKVAQDYRDGHFSLDQLDESLFASYLQTSQTPDPDLIIRTSGESRLSNFLLWQAAYAEIIIVQKAWPDFVTSDLHAALESFAKRERRFGKVSEQIAKDSATGETREFN